MFHLTVRVPLLQCILCSTFERMLPLSIVRFEKIHYYSIMVPPPHNMFHFTAYGCSTFLQQASTDLFGKKKTEHLLCFKILNVFHFYKINVNCFTFTVKLYHFYCMWKMYSTFIIFTANCVLLLQHYVVPFYSNHPLTCLTGWKL